MDDLKRLVVRAQTGDLDAYSNIVVRFQDMAIGYAYSVLGDFHLAEDAAQEAFIEAYRSLSNLATPAAFPGWLRRIVFGRCNRLTRGKRPPTVPLEAAGDVAADQAGPRQLSEQREMRDAVLEALRGLPDKQREVTALFYINGYSQNDIADFLEVPVSRVKNRLAASRKRLKERMLAMTEDELRGSCPGPEFRERIMRKVSSVEVRPQADVETGRVLLTDGRGRCLPIIIGTSEELAIQRGLEGNAPSRPMTHELFLRVLAAFDISVSEARVVDLRDETFYGELVLAREGRLRVIDCRPSDALALAIMSGARISVAEHVMAQAAAVDAGGKSLSPEEVWQTPRPSPEHGERHNERLLEVCTVLCALSDEKLQKLVGEVGTPTLLGALMPRVAPKPARPEQMQAAKEAKEAAEVVRARLDPEEVKAGEGKLLANVPRFVGGSLAKLENALQELTE